MRRRGKRRWWRRVSRPSNTAGRDSLAQGEVQLPDAPPISACTSIAAVSPSPLLLIGSSSAVVGSSGRRHHFREGTAARTQSRRGRRSAGPRPSQAGAFNVKCIAQWRSAYFLFPIVFQSERGKKSVTERGGGGEGGGRLH